MLEMIHGECLEYMRDMESASFDAVITDPPYAEVSRVYGRWTERQWFALMNPVVEEVRRLLKPTGSAVFVLQPNSEKVGRMRSWVFEFMAKWACEWNMIQDVYWWNPATPPGGGAMHGLLRGAVKLCVWLGPSECYRNQDAILWTEAEGSRLEREESRWRNHTDFGNGTQDYDERKMGEAAVRRGGVTPYNIVLMGNPGVKGTVHGSTTPLSLCKWWTRYIVPEGGKVLDPFAGTGTTGVACAEYGASFMGIERNGYYVNVARERFAGVETEACSKSS